MIALLLLLAPAQPCPVVDHADQIVEACDAIASPIYPEIGAEVFAAANCDVLFELNDNQLVSACARCAIDLDPSARENVRETIADAFAEQAVEAIGRSTFRTIEPTGSHSHRYRFGNPDDPSWTAIPTDSMTNSAECRANREWYPDPRSIDERGLPLPPG